MSPWITIQTENGPVTAHICTRGAKAKVCKFCSKRFVEKLCDFPTGAHGKTCDAGMCGKCATSVGPDLDYCPSHKHETAPPQQNLFAETI